MRNKVEKGQGLVNPYFFNISENYLLIGPVASPSPEKKRGKRMSSSYLFIYLNNLQYKATYLARITERLTKY